MGCNGGRGKKKITKCIFLHFIVILKKYELVLDHCYSSEADSCVLCVVRRALREKSNLINSTQMCNTRLRNMISPQDGKEDDDPDVDDGGDEFDTIPKILYINSMHIQKYIPHHHMQYRSIVSIKRRKYEVNEL